MRIKRYTAMARWLHWIVAALVLVQVGLGFAADWTERPASQVFLSQHVRFGLLIFGLMLLRATWRLGHVPPAYPPALPIWQRQAATVVHASLYILLLAMPVTGYVLWAWRGPTLDYWGLGPVPILFAGGDDERWKSIAGYAHEYGAYAVSALILLHISAALFHALIARDMSIGERMGYGTLDAD